jgi:hypothetical protein
MSDVTNFDVEGHPSNIAIFDLNIAQLRMGNALNVADQIFQIKV